MSLHHEGNVSFDELFVETVEFSRDGIDAVCSEPYLFLFVPRQRAAADRFAQDLAQLAVNPVIDESPRFQGITRQFPIHSHMP